MFCGNCGVKLPDDAKFCGACGTPVRQIEANTNSNEIKYQSAPEPALEAEPVPVEEPASPAEPVSVEEPASAAESTPLSIPTPTPLPIPTPAPVTVSTPKQGGGMGIIIGVLVFLIIAIIGIGAFIAYKGGLLPIGQCSHVDKDRDSVCDKCDEDMPSDQDIECVHVDKDDDGICDRCDANMPKEDEKDELEAGEETVESVEEVSVDVEEILVNQLAELESQTNFNLDDTYYALSEGRYPEDASAGSPDGVSGIVWSDIRDCDGDGQLELLALNIVPTVSNEDILVYKFQVFEVDSDGNVTCEDKKTYNLEKYQIYTIENVIYQADDAVYLIARQHRYKFKDGGKESSYMIALKYDGSDEMQKLDSDSDGVTPDNFRQLFDEIGMRNTAKGMDKKYEINYDDDIEEIGCMRARPAGYLGAPDIVSDMMYDFYRLESDMDLDFRADSSENMDIPL